MLRLPLLLSEKKQFNHMITLNLYPQRKLKLNFIRFRPLEFPFAESKLKLKRK